MPARGKDEVRAELQKACAIAHGKGSGLSLLDLVELVLDAGLPAREERARKLEEKLAEDE